MKKLIFACIITLSLLLTGCADPTNLANRAIVEAVAIDYDSGYRVSALLFSSSGSGSDTIDASQENVIKVVGTGKTLSEAIDNLSLNDGKKIYMQETKLLIIGGGFSEESINEALNTLYYDMRCSLNMPVCCANSAEEITDLQFTEGLTSAEKPLSLIENAYELGVSPKTDLLDLFADSAADRPSLIPQLTVTRNGRGMTASDDGITAVLCGSRYLDGGKLVGDFDTRQTTAILIRSKKTDKIMLNYFYNDEERTCEAYGIKIIEDSKNGIPSLNVTAKFKNRTGGKLEQNEELSAQNALLTLVRGL